MNHQQISDKGGAVWSATCAIFYHRPIDKYSKEILERAQNNLDKNGGRLPTKKANHNNGNHKDNKQLELVHLPRGKAVAIDGNWIPIIDTADFKGYIRRGALEYQNNKIVELEKIISEQKAELDKFEQLKKLLR